MLWWTDPDPDPPMFGIEIVLLKPHSRGTVQLRSADPLAAPLIRLPNLQEPSDLLRLMEGYRLAVEALDRPGIRTWCADRPASFGRVGDDEVKAAVERDLYSVPHVVGTCAMGPSPDDGAVVDTSGAVHGIEGLFVIDASIMPTVPSGFPHISTIMLAERLAERIGAPS
jgi:choline dehydrogenase-like flavoprotein